jgi:hypothetical protein
MVFYIINLSLCWQVSVLYEPHAEILALPLSRVVFPPLSRRQSCKLCNFIMRSIRSMISRTVCSFRGSGLRTALNSFIHLSLKHDTLSNVHLIQFLIDQS